MAGGRGSGRGGPPSPPPPLLDHNATQPPSHEAHPTHPPPIPLWSGSLALFFLLAAAISCIVAHTRTPRHALSMLAVGGLGAERDRQVRLHSVHTDLELDLPTSIPLPDGEEIPYGSSARLHIRDSQQESEIYQKCIRAPPNRTVFEGESPPPPYRALAHWSHHNSVISPRLGGEAVVPPPVIVPASRQRVAMDSAQPSQPPSRQV